MVEKEKALQNCLDYNENNFISSWGFSLANEWFTLKNPNLEEMDKQDVENMVNLLDNLCEDISKFQELLVIFSRTL